VTPPPSTGPGGRDRLPLKLKDALDEHLLAPGEAGSRTQLPAALAARAIAIYAAIAPHKQIPDCVRRGRHGPGRPFSR
jgi:hypothetical protein